MTQRRQTSPHGLTAAALACAAIGLLLAWAALSRHPELNVPPAVAYVAASVLLAGALRLAQLARWPDSRGDGFAALITGGMVAIGGWIALAPGAAVCARGTRPDAMQVVSGAECRTVFGVGAVVTLLMAAYAFSRWRRARRSVAALLSTLAATLLGCDGTPVVCPSDLRVRVAPRDTTIAIGQSFQPSVEYIGCGGREVLDATIIYASSDSTILDVTQSTGRATGRRAGVAKILADSPQYHLPVEIEVTVR